ncbi:chemotaxis protein CheX, partial [Mobiluncus curtisii]|nr:chemotaxis protein CheX [Mobiluncus curtisii]
IVNVIGGNMKSIVEDSGNLVLPKVEKEKPTDQDSPLVSVNLNWKGKFLVVSISDLNTPRDAA